MFVREAVASSPGVNFVFDKDSSLLSIWVRYIGVDAGDETVSKTLGLAPQSNQCANNRGRRQLQIREGTIFAKKNLILTVLGMQGTEVTVMEAEGNDGQFTLNYNIAAHFIMGYNS